MKYRTAIATLVGLSFSLGANAQRSNADYIEELKAAGYPEIQPLSFSVTKLGYALTALYKSKADRNPKMFFANISSNKDGASIVFRVITACTPSSQHARLPERVIKISDQKIEAYWMCVGGEGSVTQEIYLIKSAAGNDFAESEFAQKNYVFVHLNDLPVPFHTEGFSSALSEASGKAL